MSAAIAVFRREMKSYFYSPIAYIAVIGFLLVSAVVFFFVQTFFAQNNASLRSYFGPMPLILSVLVPALTMRGWAEERKSGSYELLVTMPISEWSLVAGKFMAAFAVLALAFAATLPLALMVSAFGDFDVGVIAGEYFGILLVAASYSALGLAISSASKNQVSAFIFGFVALIALALLGNLSSWISLPLWLARLVNYVSVTSHFQSFTRGVLDSRDILYFAALCLGSLYLTAKGIALRKWS